MQGARNGHMGVLRIAAALSLALICSITSSVARADDALADDNASGDFAAAARAFQEGQKAQLIGDFARAAELFELADDLAPTPEALRSTIRNHDAAKHPARAATFALAAKERYPDDALTLATANDVLERAASSLARITVRCDAPCTVLIDGEALTVEAAESADAFVPPGERTIEARFGTEQRATETIELLAGEARELELRAPALPELAVATPRHDAVPEANAPRVVTLTAPAPTSAERVAKHEGGLPPWLFLTASALTVTAATAAIASGVDALDKRDAYEADPTRERYMSGLDSERRTNVLLIATASLAATSMALLAFTDWEGDEERPARAAMTLSLSPLAPNIVLRSTLP
jgi:hypothetical protein